MLGRVFRSFTNGEEIKGRPTGRPPVPAAQRFWSKVKVESVFGDDCWEWQFGKDRPNGYGRFAAFGENYAHRVSWILEYGNIPNNLLVLHRCDNRSCVRPSHLFLGTIFDNMQDKVRKNRHPDFRGEKNPYAKFDWKTIRTIRQRLASGERQSEVASSMFIPKQIVNKIKLNEIWKVEHDPEASVGMNQAEMEEVR